MGLVLISHSGSVVEGLRDMVGQVAGDDVAVGIAGGTEDGRLGTSAPRIAAALRSVLDAGEDGVVVLFDLGSAALSLELALEDLEPVDRDRVLVSEAPLVEGAILAAVQASVGASTRRGGGRSGRRRDDAQDAAGLTDARTDPRRGRSCGPACPSGGQVRPGGSKFESRIVIRQGDREADAKSLIALLGLTIRPSSEITLSAVGPDADAALSTLSAELSPYVSQAG